MRTRHVDYGRCHDRFDILFINHIYKKDMATEYPNSEFVGIDMCDVFPTNIRPANVTFQVSNVLEGLPFEDNSFDMVNFSLFILALKKDQWLPLMKEIHRILKPGGLFHSREASMLVRQKLRNKNE